MPIHSTLATAGGFSVTTHTHRIRIQISSLAHTFFSKLILDFPTTMVFAALSAALVLALAGLSVYFLSRPAKLPGTLEPAGEFELDAPDLDDAATRDERARDLSLIHISEPTRPY